jgi:hypothetical protein
VPAVTNLTFPEALQQVHLAVDALLDTNDFAVVDVVLQKAAISHLAGLLLSSTVWFDVTNGKAFASHWDDGLIFPEFRQLAQV